MPRKIVHDLCKCGNQKQVVSSMCRDCYRTSRANSPKSTYNKHKNLCQCGDLKKRYSNYCLQCLRKNELKQLLECDLPVGNFKYKNNSDPNNCVKVRQNAQKVAKALKLTDNGCVICSFPFIDVCHIKSIQSFSDNTPINVVNNPDNLIILCKNCHWLFDHGYPSIEEIQNFYKYEHKELNLTE